MKKRTTLLTNTGMPQAVIDAVRSIYNVLPQGSLVIDLPATDTEPAKRLKANFPSSAGNNAVQNITQVNFLRDVLTRAHPAGFAVIFKAALDTGVHTLEFSSCWRPLLGSIAHRIGLGHDVNKLDALRINRSELRNGVYTNPGSSNPTLKETPHGNDDDSDNVTEEEIRKFHEYKQADLCNNGVRFTYSRLNNCENANAWG